MKAIRLLFLLFSVFPTLDGRAQTDYSTTRTIQKNDYTYQCDREGGWITLYNSNDRFTYAMQERKDGIPLEIYRDLSYSNTKENVGKAKNILAESFTEAELNALKGVKFPLFVILIINTTTGKVQEVKFEFSSTTNFRQIPVERYRQIELALKENLLFELTEAGRNLNFGLYGIQFKP